MPTAIRSVKINLSSEKKTEELASRFSKILQPGNTIFLYGEMGVGKTTFVRHLIHEFQKVNNLGLTEVTSPTFSILNEYEINKIRVNHYDLFRLQSVKELENLGIFENSTKIITLIEWPQIIKEKPKNLIELFFEYGKDHQKRSLHIKGLNL